MLPVIDVFFRLAVSKNVIIITSLVLYMTLSCRTVILLPLLILTAQNSIFSNLFMNYIIFCMFSIKHWEEHLVVCQSICDSLRTITRISMRCDI